MVDPALVIRVETLNGVFLRPIMPASLLPPDVEKGGAAEDALPLDRCMSETVRQTAVG
jgi:hypothetical protein